MKSHWISSLIAMLFVALAVTGIMGFSSNIGPNPSRFELDGQRMLYRYDPAPLDSALLQIAREKSRAKP